YSGAGIYRPVTLVCLPEAHILPESIVIQTTDYARRKVRVAFAVAGGGKADNVKVEILDGEQVLDSARAASGTAEFVLGGAELWSPDHPKLYTARLTYGTDVQTVRFGIRTVEVDAADGFRINGQRTLLLGACIHHDNGIIGAVGHPFAERRKIALLKKAGFNAIRSAHNPASKAILDACDELGVMVLDEYVDMWYIHKTVYDYANFFEKNWKDDLKLLVEKDRNHPSVVMYSIGNEVSETAQPKGIELAGLMRDELHALDDRPVTCGINIFFNFLSSMGFGVYSDEKAKQEAEKAEKNKGKVKKKAVGSEFINNIAGLMGAGFMKFGATLHGSDVKTRDAFAKLDVAGYNYGVNRYTKDLKRYPERVILGSETFAVDAMKFYETASANPALIGDFVWTGMDYLGEVGLGAWDYKAYAPDFEHTAGWIAAGSGTIDLVGTETGQMEFMQVAYGLSPIRIGVEPVCFSGEKHSPAAWRDSNAIESWSWDGCEGKKAAIEVYTKGASVELLLNGKHIGQKKRPEFGWVRFKTAYEPGELTAVSYDGNGQEIARTSLKSAGKETVLTLLPETETVKKGDLLYVRLRYTDGNGVVKPAVRGNIKVRVSGGKLLALGSACPYNKRGYLTDTTDTYYGEALAVIEPTGNVTVRAESRYGKKNVTVKYEG
ncbi:MAG: DUF4982 domain-containing protein, partial [Lachnospiraceae bacterium]|nr:DUF4982 domain-containing protein [Lachnospiraceae bacterium]